MASLSSDLPNSNPKDDLFGHAPFAKNLTDSICRHIGSDGLVLALYGPWGSGKSTVLKYINFFIEQKPDQEKPILMEFNPWWFSGQENLARAFISQLQAVLPKKSDKFEKLGELLGEFAEGIGGLIDLTGLTGGSGEVIGKIIGMLTRSKPKDIPALKADIDKILMESGKRIVITIDDIDRLTPDEIRQLFTVIKALANFPNTIYLLAFDREIATVAIENLCGIQGDRFLEKIIQVPFELPPIDRESLRSALFNRLNEILIDTPDGLFDTSYWINIYFNGIDSLIKVPRDIVRFSNTLSVTYPSVYGEVNSVDFIALEALRVFLPDLYDTIRTNPEKFSGIKLSGRTLNDPDQIFYNNLIESLPESLKSPIKAMLERIFPKITMTLYGTEWLTEWRKNLRACHPDIFSIYFRFAVPTGSVSNVEMQNIISVSNSPDRFSELILDAIKIRRPDGLSKARVILERLMDYVNVDIPAENIPDIIQAFFSNGDKLIDPKDKSGSFEISNTIRVSRLITQLLRRLTPDLCFQILIEKIPNGDALSVMLEVLKKIEKDINKEGIEDELIRIENGDFGRLKDAWLDNIRFKSKDQNLLSHPELNNLLFGWQRWTKTSEVQERCEEMIITDENMFKFIVKFLRHSRSQTVGDPVVRLHPRLNPTWLTDYINIDTLANRLMSKQNNNEIPQYAQAAASRFLTEYEMLQSGNDPDAHVFDDN